MEREDGEFFARVADAYDELARSEPARIREIDAEQDAGAGARRRLEAIADLLGRRCGRVVAGQETLASV